MINVGAEAPTPLSQESVSRITPSLSYNVDPRCDMRCEYCPPYYENYQASEAVLDDDFARIAFLGAADAGLVTFRLSGGEPLLRPQHVAAVAAGLEGERHSQLIDIRLNTNASRLGDNLELLQQAGINILKVSLDSLDEALFREITGSRRHPEILQAIETAHSIGMAVELNMVYTRKTAGGVFDLVDYCIANKLEGLKILDLVEYDDPGYFRTQYLPPTALIAELTEKYGTPRQDLLSSGRGVRMIEFQATAETRVLLKDCLQGTTYSRTFCAGCRHFPCQEGFYNLTLNSDGKLKPCRLITESFIDLQVELAGKDPTTARLAVKEIIEDLLLRYYSDIYVAQLWQPPDEQPGSLAPIPGVPVALQATRKPLEHDTKGTTTQ